MDPIDYSFESLLFGLGQPAGRIICPSLCYLISLTNSVTHQISQTLAAKRILSWLYDIEEQALDSEHLESGEEYFNRYFDGGFYPQTPCMLVDQWSPINAMLERGMEARILNREAKFHAVATGIWEPRVFCSESQIDSATTDEELFWAILAEAFRRARERKIWVSIIVQPGWDYTSAINSLPPWPAEEVEKAGRILWKRTPQG